MDYVNDPLASGVTSERRSHEDKEVTPVVLGGRGYKLVGVSFGLLCILQAALNVSLRHALNASDNKISGTDVSSKNQTEELDHLRRKLMDSAGKLTELDHLKRKLESLGDHFQQGWVYFHHSLYYISSIKKSWQDSRDDCLQRGADLVIINTKEEHDFTRKFHTIVWIGLTDTESKRSWKWVDGTPMTQSYWASGEPNNYGGRRENCVHIRLYDEENSWNDIPCEDQYFWICEKTVAL